MNLELDANGPNCWGNAGVPALEPNALHPIAERHILQLIAEVLPKPAHAPA